ncbi:MAG TPA: hypothetical protein DCL54_00410 [Alphaproteobacteria bacterium]|nr:hypothetical protein [Alphaproteobacteria bacterium]HAJ45028.1 hypothetical protein [Alphaproteobacteria bacterium]
MILSFLVLIVAAVGLANQPTKLSDDAAARSDLLRQITLACEKAPPGPVGARGMPAFCKCFSETSVDAVLPRARVDQQVFLLLTETGGMPAKGQVAAKQRLNMPVETYMTIWERLGPVGAAAGKACLPKAP